MIPRFCSFRAPAGLAGLELSAAEKSFLPHAAAQAWPDFGAQSQVMESLNLWSHLEHFPSVSQNLKIRMVLLGRDFRSFSSTPLAPISMVAELNEPKPQKFLLWSLV